MAPILTLAKIDMGTIREQPEETTVVFARRRLGGCNRGYLARFVEGNREMRISEGTQGLAVIPQFDS